MKDAETDALEADVKKAVKAFCKEKGAWWFMSVPGGYSRRTVDFHICYRGQFVACETKRPRATNATRIQGKELYDVRQAGGYAIVENSLSLETLRAVFTKIEDSINTHT